MVDEFRTVDLRLGSSYFVETKYLPTELPAPRRDEHARTLHLGIWHDDARLAFRRL